MCTLMRLVLIVALATPAYPCLAQPYAATTHGRAGETVGAERVDVVSARSGAMSFWRQVAFAPRPGRAGGPLGWVDASAGTYIQRPVSVQRYSLADVALTVTW